MAAYDTLRAAIDSYIKANGNKEITGTVLNDILNAMVSALGADTRFAGVAVPTTNPGNPEGNVVYFASQAGTYSNFGGIVLPLGIHILVWNGTAWTSQTWFSVDNTPTQNSQNLATSGGILQAIVDAVGVERLRAIGAEVTSCSFDGTTKKISFFNSADDTLFQLDATAFVIDGMVSDVKIEDGNLVIQFNTDAGKQDIEIPLTDIFNPANYYTKTAIDELLVLYYTKTETDALLTAINNKLADGCLYRGMAEPTTNPPTPTTKVFYIATKAGTYTNFGNIAVTDGITILKYDGSNWSKEQISYSDGVFDISAYNGTSYADLSAALGTNGANIPQNLRKGGMSIKFVQSSDNKYVQARCMAQNFTTDVTQWQGSTDEVKAGSKDLAESGGVAEAVGVVNRQIEGYSYEEVFPFTTTQGTSLNKTVNCNIENGEMFSILISSESIDDTVTVYFYDDYNGNGNLVTSTTAHEDTVYNIEATARIKSMKVYVAGAHVTGSNGVFVAMKHNLLDSNVKSRLNTLETASTEHTNELDKQYRKDIGITDTILLTSASDDVSVTPSSPQANIIIRLDGTTGIDSDYCTVKNIELLPYHAIILNGGNDVYVGYNIATLFRTDSEGVFIEPLLNKPYTNGNKKVHYVNDTNATVYVGICVYPSQAPYIILELKKAASVEDFDNLDNNINNLDKNIKLIENSNYGKPYTHIRFGVDITSGEALESTVQLSSMLEKNKTYLLIVENTTYAGRIDINKLLLNGSSVTAYYNDEQSATTSHNRLIAGESMTTIKPTDNVDSIKFVNYASSSIGTGTVYINIILYDAIKGFFEKADIDKKDYSSAIQSRFLIEADRPYYFGNDWRNALSYNDVSYLDRRIKDVPEGKHFIFNTDSHIDYLNETYGNGLGIGYAQKETIIMKYVRERLSIKNVIFGGDCIGGIPSKYKAAQVLSSYCDDKFDAFGADFIYTQGNHDANYPEVGNSGHTREESIISDSEIYKRTTMFIRKYGKAVFDEALLEAIDSLDGIDASGKTELKAWAMLHYYTDDDKQKIRYIVFETGDYSNAIDTYLISSSNISPIGFLQTDFFIQALCNVPKMYDVVVVGHQWFGPEQYVTDFSRSGFSWNTLHSYILSQYKTKGSVYYINQETAPVKQTMIDICHKLGYDNGKQERRYSFAEVKGSGRVFVIGGHYHADDGLIWSPKQQNALLQHIELSNPSSTTIYDDSVLEIKFDRCCATNQGVAYPQANPTAVSYPNEGTGSGEEERLGTVNEVLFDVVTITDDNKVICTRFGAGSSSYDREYILPVLSN